MKLLIVATLATSTLISLPAVAGEPCAECPRVQLLRAENQVRIAAEDDNDPYDALRHRVRFVATSGSSAWTDWSETNAYGLRTPSAGQIQAETIDLDGNVGRAVIHITAPDVEEGSRGPGTVAEDSSVESRWNDDANYSDGTTSADLPADIDNTDAEDWLNAESWDHSSVCPVSSADSDSACSTARGPNNGWLASLFAIAAIMLGRARRR